MKVNSRLALYVFISGFFLCLDQVLKYFARVNPDFSFYIWKNWLGWEYLENLGVAFSLPMPNWVLILITPLILLGLFIFLYRKKNKTNLFYLSLFLIISGAVSNFIDRVLFGVTIDYLRILTGVINMADVMIVVGVGLLLLGEYRKKG